MNVAASHQVKDATKNIAWIYRSTYDKTYIFIYERYKYRQEMNNSAER